MDDRELLEMAAKANWGDEIDDVCSVRWLDDDQAIGYTHADNQDHNGVDQEFVWNPLDSDHDALRLAVKLRLTVSWDRFNDADYATATPPHTHQGYDCVVDQDPAAATRRAIVRAAAELARAGAQKG